jgi:hypothetical protein
MDNVDVAFIAISPRMLIYFPYHGSEKIQQLLL